MGTTGRDGRRAKRVPSNPAKAPGPSSARNHKPRPSIDRRGVHSHPIENPAPGSVPDDEDTAPPNTDSVEPRCHSLVISGGVAVVCADAAVARLRTVAEMNQARALLLVSRQ